MKPETGSRPTAQIRPSDHGPVSMTSCPRRRSSLMTEASTRDSTCTRPGCASWGAKELGKCEVWNIGASFAACNAVGVIGIEVEHLRPRPQTEAQAVDDRRALQPASAWRARDQVSTAISDRDMNRVAAHSPARLGPGAGPVAFGDKLGRAPRK